MTDTNTTNELALSDKQLNTVVELESKRDSLMTAGIAGKLAEILTNTQSLQSNSLATAAADCGIYQR